LIAGEYKPGPRLNGIWGQRHLRYIKQHRRTLYTEFLISGKLNDYLADLNEEAEEMFLRLVGGIAKKRNITEKLKAIDQMRRVQEMNNIRNAVPKLLTRN